MVGSPESVKPSPHRVAVAMREEAQPGRRRAGVIVLEEEMPVHQVPNAPRADLHRHPVEAVAARQSRWQVHRLKITDLRNLGVPLAGGWLEQEAVVSEGRFGPRPIERVD